MTGQFSRVRPRWPLILAVLCPLIGTVDVSRGEQIVIVAPNAYENAEAPASAGSGGLPNFRTQANFAADQFAELPVGGAYLISFRYRPDGATGSPADLSANEYTVSASVTSVAPDEMSLCYEDNITGPVTVVRAAGSWQDHTDNLPPGGGPKVFDIEFALDTPYRYDPAEGNLLFDGVVYGFVLPISFDRLASGERSDAAVLVRSDPVSPCTVAAGYVGSIVTEFTFVSRLEGACCLPKGTCTENLTKAACTDLGGAFRGMDTTCDGGSICLGACCQGVVGCSETLISQCSGDFRGYGSICSQGCPCPDPFADTDLDGDVDQLDFAILQSCFAGPNVTVSGVCLCFDWHPVGAPDGDVDAGDVLEFELCASGPGVPLDPACDTR
jgi:hypothetical protein